MKDKIVAIKAMSARRMCAGNASTEVLVAILALAPFLAGIPLLGKQMDIKHKTYDATRYSVWERTVWRSEGVNRKSEHDIVLEARDRTLGDPSSGMLAVESLHSEGITENRLWRDRARQRLIDYDRNSAALSVDFDDRQTPVDVGYFLVPGVAHGDEPIAAAANLLRVDDLGLNRRAFATSDLSVGVRPVLSQIADARPVLGHDTHSSAAHPTLLHRATGAVLSDTWSASDENEFRRRTDYVTTNELIELLELPAQPIGMQAIGKGRALYGEGQFGWDPDLRPRSSTLPAAYITRR